MQTIKCTFVLLVVVLVQCVLSDSCFKKECMEKHEKEAEKEECAKKMTTDGKIDAVKMKAEFDKCAEPKYLEKMKELADECNGKEVKDLKEMKKKFEEKAGCELGM